MPSVERFYTFVAVRIKVHIYTFLMCVLLLKLFNEDKSNGIYLHITYGKYRVEIRKNQVSIQNKTFADKLQAEQWATDFESKIERILNIKSKKLKKLSPEKVEVLGGGDGYNRYYPPIIK